MTTYILHGGRTSKECYENDKFFKAFSYSLEKRTINILLCYWAREKNEVEDLVNRDVPKIHKFAGDRNISITITKDLEDFNQKINDTDVLYIAGGSISKLKKEFDNIKNIKEITEGKVIIGSSAGAFLLARQSINSFDKQEQGVNVGLGLVPISVLCHWDIEDQKEQKLEALKKFAPLDPIVTLAEGEFITLYL
jgi:cyanophycinase-like exopeptidase